MGQNDANRATTTLGMWYEDTTQCLCEQCAIEGLDSDLLQRRDSLTDNLLASLKRAEAGQTIHLRRMFLRLTAKRAPQKHPSTIKSRTNGIRPVPPIEPCMISAP